MKMGRRAVGGLCRSVMLRIYAAQWYTCLIGSGGALCEFHDERLHRLHARLNAIPDETTILNFRHLLERHELTKAIFAAVSEHLAAKGELLRGGTIVDATLIAASPSTKNKEGRRDPRCRSRRRETSGISA